MVYWCVFDLNFGLKRANLSAYLNVRKAQFVEGGPRAVKAAEEEAITFCLSLSPPRLSSEKNGGFKSDCVNLRWVNSISTALVACLTCSIIAGAQSCLPCPAGSYSSVSGGW